MSINEVFSSLDLEKDVRLQRFRKRDLAALLNRLARSKSKLDIASIISDEAYFSLEEIIETCEKIDKRLLFNLLREPKNEKLLRKPLSKWLKDREYSVRYDVPPPIKGRWRSIDLVGLSDGGVLAEPSIAVLEIETKARKRSVESAFRRVDALRVCSDYSYVALSPYVYIKHRNLILEMVEEFRSIGVLISDKREVTFELREAEKTKYDRDKWERVAAHFK